MNNLQSAWLNNPNYRIVTKQIKVRLKIEIDNTVIAHSDRIVMLSEQDHQTVYYFPESDVQLGLFHNSDKSTFCPYKGTAEHYSLYLDSQRIEVAAWCYRDPFEQVSDIRNYIAFYPEIMQHTIFD